MRIVLIRTHNPTDKMLERIENIYALQDEDTKVIISVHLSMESFDRIVDTYYSFDITTKPMQMNKMQLLDKLPMLVKTDYILTGCQGLYIVGKKKGEQLTWWGRTVYVLKKNIKQLIDKYPVHMYTDKTITDNFALDIRQRVLDRNLAWNYHNECIALAVGDKVADYIWVLEEDLEYTGSFKEFFEIHEKLDFDLLGNGSIVLKDRSWFSYYMSRKLLALLPHFWPKYKEHIICMSRRFYQKMVEFLKDGYCGHSEISTIAFCGHFKMKYLDIDGHHISRQYNWKLNDEFKTESVEQYVETLKQNNEKLLVHPCKY